MPYSLESRTWQRSRSVFLRTRERPPLERGREMGVQRLTMMATVWEQSRSNQANFSVCRNVFLVRGAYEANFARVQPRFRGEPFPHEGTGRTVVDGIDEALDVVIHWSSVLSDGGNWQQEGTHLGISTWSGTILVGGPSRRPLSDYRCREHVNTA